MQYPQLPAAAFISAALVLVPLPWHWRARNVATLAIIAWLFVVDIIYGVNALIWAGNVNNYAPVWCDISTKIVVGASFALPLCTLCVCKHLETVSSNRNVRFDNADKHRRMIFESVMCFGIPAIFMALHYIVQGHRFDIIENLGCQATTYISIPAIMLILFPQLLFAVITFIYAGVALYHFIQRRITFAAHLHNSNSALTTDRYLRLIAMAITEMVWGTVFTSVNLWNNVWGGLRPWTNWADVHSHFSRVDMFAQAAIPPKFFSLILLLWWTIPASSIIFFFFFGFGEEARKEYRKLWVWLRKTVLRRDAQKGSLYTASFPNSHSNRRPIDIDTLASVELGPTDIEKKASNPLQPTSSHASSFTAMPPTPMKEEDTYSISTLSYYGQSNDSMHMPSPSVASHHHRTSRPPSPAPALPVAAQKQHEPEMFTVPAYHRPFSPPSVYPIVTPNTVPWEGIQVTIHQQAEVDRIV